MDDALYCCIASGVRVQTVCGDEYKNLSSDGEMKNNYYLLVAMCVSKAKLEKYQNLNRFTIKQQKDKNSSTRKTYRDTRC